MRATRTVVLLCVLGMCQYASQSCNSECHAYCPRIVLQTPKREPS